MDLRLRDQIRGVGLGAFVVEEVGVDRSIKAWIVQFDREIVTALGGALRPGDPDFIATDIDPVAWRIVAGPVCLGDDADTLVWRLRVTISPWNS